MTTDTFVKGQLALLCWRNAPAGKPFLGMKAIAFIERNRHRAGWHGGDWMALIAEDENYSPYSMELMSERRIARDEFPDLRDDIFQRFLWEVDRIYAGEAGDAITEGALFYADNTQPITRPWFLEKIVRAEDAEGKRVHPQVAQVGPLTLWR